MAEIKTIIRADSTQHDSTVKKSANEIYKYQKKADDAKKSMAQMGNSVKGVAGSFLTKFIPAIGGALTAVEGFKKMLKSTEEGTDMLERALYTAKSTVNQFFTSISTNGFDNFINGLQDIRKNAKEAYDALDNLSTVEMWVKIEKAKLEADMAIQRAIISNPNATKLEIEEAQRKLNLSQDTFDKLGGIIKTNTEIAYNKRLKEVSGVGNKYVSIYDLNKWLSMRENDALNGTNILGKAVDDFFKQHATVSTYQHTVYSPTGVAAYNETREDIKWDSEMNKEIYTAMNNIFRTTDNVMQDLGNLQIKISNEEKQIADRQNQINRLNNKAESKTGGSGTSNKGGSTITLPTYEEGSIADLQAKLKELKDIYVNNNLSIEEANQNLKEQAEIEEQILNIERERHGMPVVDLIPELKPITTQQAIMKTQLKEIKQEFVDLIALGNSFGETASAIGSIFNSLGDIAGETDGQMLKMFGDIAGHISNILPKIFSLTAAEEGEAMAAGTASAAKLPFPYNLGAIASIIAELIAVFATISSYSKFAEGGIVGGNSTIGDYNLARVNKGEMILNGKQQAHLFNILNGIGVPSNNGVSGSVVFRISGNDLVGTLNNYNKRMGRVN